MLKRRNKKKKEVVSRKKKKVFGERGLVPLKEPRFDLNYYPQRASQKQRECVWSDGEFGVMFLGYYY